MTDCTETSEAVKGQEGMAKAGTAMTDCTETSEAVKGQETSEAVKGQESHQRKERMPRVGAP
jgi:hypothetical protein